MTKQLPSPEILRKALRYDQATGELYWRKRAPNLFTSGKYSAERKCNMWNNKNGNMRAFTAIKVGSGYLYGRIFGKAYYAHRIIWAIFYGVPPSGDIDHINGDKTDNKISNLRDVSRSTNCRNAKRSKSNTSGTTGVYFGSREKAWVAQIYADGHNIRLGVFDNIESAISARAKAEIEHCFHKNHGRAK